MTITRKEYFYIGVVTNLISIVFQDSIVALALTILVYTFAVIARCTNVGLPKWWCAALLIPALNVYPLFMLSFAPTDYHKKDSPKYKKRDGWFEFGFVLYTVIAVCAALVVLNFIFSWGW
jgi:hypothetical protein